MHSGVLSTAALTSCRPITLTDFFCGGLLICFVIKLDNILVVNYAETTVEGEQCQWAVADSDFE